MAKARGRREAVQQATPQRRRDCPAEEQVRVQRLGRIDHRAAEHRQIQADVTGRIQRHEPARARRRERHVIHQADQRATSGEVPAELGGRGARVLGEQARAHGSDERRTTSVRRLDGQVTFGVEPHRAVAEVRGADLDDAIVRHQHLGVDVDRNTRHHGADQAQAAMTILAPQVGDGLVAQQAHRRILQPPRLLLRQDDDDLGTARVGQARAEHPHHVDRGQILVLGVHPALRRGDHPDGQGRDLADRTRPRPRVRAGNAGADVLDVHGQLVGPRCRAAVASDVSSRRQGPYRRRSLAPAGAPSRPDQLAEIARDRS